MKGGGVIEKGVGLAGNATWRGILALRGGEGGRENLLTGIGGAPYGIVWYKLGEGCRGALLGGGA